MKKLVAAFVCTALAVSLGCTEHKSTPGGPGATGSQSRGKEPTRDTTRDTTAKDNTFTVKAPSGTTDIKQGQAKEITIDVNRGKEFKQNIKLTLTSEEKGVTVKPETAELKASDNATGLKFTLEASKEAAIGEHKITVKATPESGSPTEATFNVKVAGP